MRALSVGLLVRSIALIASLFVFVPLSFAQSTTGHPDSWSGQDSNRTAVGMPRSWP